MSIIDAHAHLWMRQNTVVDGQPVRTLSPNGSRSEFFGQEVQMLPPFMIDGTNSAEVFLSNMDYARVGGAVIVQEIIDGLQNDYLREVQQKYATRFFCYAMPELRHEMQRKLGLGTPLEQATQLLDSGFRGLAFPGHRLFAPGSGIALNSPEMMDIYKLMEQRGAFLSMCLYDGDYHVQQMKEVIAECPDLTIVIGHFGMVTVPGWMEQIKLAHNRNVYVESGGITWLFNSEFYPYPSAIRAIRAAADEVGIRKLMWGSDYPRTITAITYKMSYDFVLKDPENLLSEADKRAFLGENAERLYGFYDVPLLPYIKNMSE
ncbi:MAG: amidohydrolase [Bacteroidales bacterium]|nr:amidohydrolase [Bacteroidales bacterium]